MSEAKNNRPSEMVYQIYPSSFNDSKTYPLAHDDPREEGLGDLKGITEKLDYIKSLNFDAVWISPFFLTPKGDKGDGGYAVSDYQKVDPRFGTNEDFEELIKKAHEKGLKVYTDFVMCHTSDEHEWFQKSVKREKGFENLYVWADGKIDEHGVRTPPNNWKSVFEGDGDRKDKSAWEFNEERGQYYLHHFNVSQPAINANVIDGKSEGQDAIIGEMKKILDKGVDGLRLDAVSFANYDPELRDNPPRLGMDGSTFDSQYLQHSMCQDSTVAYLARIRDMMDKCVPPKKALGEAIAGREGGYNAMPVSATYVNETTGLHSCYTEPKFWPDKNNGKMSGYPSAGELKAHLHDIEHYFPNGAMCNYLSNHDFSRAATRMMPDKCPEDMRTKVLQQLMAINFSLPGSVCMYQGEELGLPDARIPEDIPYEKTKDKLDKNCRDIARDIFPHDSTKKNAGFSESDNPYLPPIDSYKVRAVNLQDGDDLSMLEFTRKLAKTRQDNPALLVGSTTVLNTPDPIFAFTRQTNDQTVLFAANMSNSTVKFKASDVMDQKTLSKLNISQDKEIEIGAYGFTRRGLILEEEKQPLTKAELKNGHTGTKLLAVDLLLNDIFHHSEQIKDIVNENGWKPADRISIEKNTHEQLLAAPNDAQKVTIGGSTLLTMTALKGLNPEVSVDFIGAVAANDENGARIKQHLKDTDIKHLTPDWPNGIPTQNAISHIVKTGSHDIVATHAGTQAQALHEILKNDKNLLEASIAKSDIVYLPGSITEKFGQSLVNEILRLRWDYHKELVLALPVHATFGDSDPQTFQRLVSSANIITGNDMEFCRIYELNGNTRPITDDKMKIVTDKIQESFDEEILQNNERPCPRGQVAFITRGNQPALLVTKKEGVKEFIGKFFPLLKNDTHKQEVCDAINSALGEKVEEKLCIEDISNPQTLRSKIIGAIDEVYSNKPDKLNNFLNDIKTNKTLSNDNPLKIYERDSGVKKIPVQNIENVQNIIGSGDVATAAFLDGELRGLSHEQSARFAMAMASEKIQQQDESPYLLDINKAREKAFLRKDLIKDKVRASYEGIATSQSPALQRRHYA